MLFFFVRSSFLTTFLEYFRDRNRDGETELSLLTLTLTAAEAGLTPEALIQNAIQNLPTRLGSK